MEHELKYRKISIHFCEPNYSYEETTDDDVVLLLLLISDILS